MECLCTGYITFCCIKVTIAEHRFACRISRFVTTIGGSEQQFGSWETPRENQKKMPVRSESFNVLPGQKKLNKIDHSKGAGIRCMLPGT
jgi:hypothetical protein